MKLIEKSQNRTSVLIAIFSFFSKLKACWTNLKKWWCHLAHAWTEPRPINHTPQRRHVSPFRGVLPEVGQCARVGYLRSLDGGFRDYSPETVRAGRRRRRQTHSELDYCLVCSQWLHAPYHGRALPATSLAGCQLVCTPCVQICVGALRHALCTYR